MTAKQFLDEAKDFARRVGGSAGKASHAVNDFGELSEPSAEFTL